MRSQGGRRRGRQAVSRVDAVVLLSARTVAAAIIGLLAFGVALTALGAHPKTTFEEEVTTTEVVEVDPPGYWQSYECELTREVVVDPPPTEVAYECELTREVTVDPPPTEVAYACELTREVDPPPTEVTYACELTREVDPPPTEVAYACELTREVCTNEQQCAFNEVTFENDCWNEEVCTTETYEGTCSATSDPPPYTETYDGECTATSDPPPYTETYDGECTATSDPPPYTYTETYDGECTATSDPPPYTETEAYTGTCQSWTDPPPYTVTQTSTDIQVRSVHDDNAPEHLDPDDVDPDVVDPDVASIQVICEGDPGPGKLWAMSDPDDPSTCLAVTDTTYIEGSCPLDADGNELLDDEGNCHGTPQGRCLNPDDPTGPGLVIDTGGACLPVFCPGDGYYRDGWLPDGRPNMVGSGRFLVDGCDGEDYDIETCPDCGDDTEPEQLAESDEQPAVTSVTVCRTGDDATVTWAATTPTPGLPLLRFEIELTEVEPPGIAETSVAEAGDRRAVVQAEQGSDWRVRVRAVYTDDGAEAHGAWISTSLSDSTAACDRPCGLLEGNEAFANAAMSWNPVIPTQRPQSPRDPYDETGVAAPPDGRSVILGGWMYPAPAAGSETITDPVLNCSWVYAGGEISFDRQTPQPLPIAGSDRGVRMLDDLGAHTAQRDVSWRMVTWWRAVGPGFATGECDGALGGPTDPVCATAVETGQATYFDVHSFVVRDL